MIEITNFKLSCGSSHWHGSESDLLQDEGFIKLKQVYEYLKENGFCHVRVNGGDYDGSIAKFTLDDDIDRDLYTRNWYSSDKSFMVEYAYHGRLSWVGKRNNPKFTLMNSTCDVLLDYEGEEILKRFDLKKEGKKLLEQDVEDIYGNKLTKGDKVLYMNLRYGSGGMLCHGTVKSFKAHARDGYVSVIIENDNCSGEESECRQPYNQVYKKDKQ
ncbi:hypothetical protein vBVpaMR16F_125 [Vibrio phage vB_VpaM_R16F]|nr:hypothetical protein vBVpaMR16F_125 [Vibrio phage vB_VpaM_R16F]